ncbi:hypothetical protein NFI96_029646, partial [Prochilodus magdalenae]
ETSAQTIDPLVGEVQLPEGDDLTLSSNYTTTDTNSVLQWYRQSLGSSPEFLLYISLYGAKQRDHKQRETWHLKKSCVSQSISPLEEKVDAVEGETSAQTIDPLVGEVQLPEGDDLTLSCNYTASGTNDELQWYRQSPGSSPEFLLYISLYGTKSDPPPRMSVVVDKDLNRVDLKISSAAVSDSVLYYCALRPTVTGNPDTLYRNWFYV